MRKSITISSFRKIPGAFLVVFILFLLTEWIIYSNRPNLIEDYWNKFLINEHALLDLPGDYDYLIMGDSIQKTGIYPIPVSDNILNLGLPGGKPMGLFLLLERYLKGHNPPKAIFLYVDPEDTGDSIFVILRYFISNLEFISIWKDLTWGERRIFIMRYWASLDLRKVDLTIRDKYPYSNAVFVKHMIENRGYMPSPRAGKSIGDNYFLTHKERYQNQISISKRDMKYLDRIIDLASSKNIKIIFLGFLLPEELYDILEKTGFNSDYTSFFEILKQHYPEAIFVKDPILYLENKYFGDASHVNNSGSKIYTMYFKNQAFTPIYQTLEKN